VKLNRTSKPWYSNRRWHVYFTYPSRYITLPYTSCYVLSLYVLKVYCIALDEVLIYKGLFFRTSRLEFRNWFKKQTTTAGQRIERLLISVTKRIYRQNSMHVSISSIVRMSSATSRTKETALPAG